ncbi:MAG TPA: acetate/propionate family kinase, partial [Candidatus Competibacteraceae bacterium]|nr:acetate/propionate family kinase [Candidatus Competibacteraceae bacterium]
MADNTILVLNAGSSSLKFSLFLAADKTLQPVLSGQLQGLYTAPTFQARDTAGAVIGDHRWEEGHRLGHDGAIAYLTDFLRQYRSEYQLIAVGHRVVHGGVEYSAPVRVNTAIVSQLERLVPLAPLHQPHNLTPIKILLQRTPPLPQVACFDTAFHHTHPPVAQAFALPPAITERGVRRYGFHGLSYEYIASVLPAYDAQAAGGRTVVLHLGNGASMCALRASKSVASTMGFTGVDGLPMGTRCGNLDPGVMLYFLDELGMDARAIEKLIYTQSGLLGVSGLSSDMRTLEASQDPRAQFAIDLFVYRIGRELGSLVAALGGLNALVFTAGIGEHSTLIRER